MGQVQLPYVQGGFLALIPSSLPKKIKVVHVHVHGISISQTYRMQNTCVKIIVC